MSVASATRVFAAGTTAEDALRRCVRGKDSSVAFIESSANLGTVSPASCGAPTCYGGLFTSYPKAAGYGTVSKLRKPLICRYLPSPVIPQELAPFQGG
jgi:hypothetical protein